MSDSVYVQYMALAQLVGARRNAKEHDIGLLDSSIRRFGFVSPVLIDERSGRLVAGHGRVDDLRRMKSRGESPPERVAIAENGEWMIPVIRGVSFEDEEEAEAYLIADNKIVEAGGWDEQQLVSMLSDLAAIGDDMLLGVGFDSDDLDEMMRRMQGKSAYELENGKEIADEIPEQYIVLITCDDESQQSDLLMRLSEEGYKCKALLS